MISSLYLTLKEIDHDLSVAYNLKELYIKFNKNPNLQTAKTQLNSLLDVFKRTSIAEFHDIPKMLKKWKNEIVTSFHQMGLLNQKICELKKSCKMLTDIETLIA